VPDPAAGRPEEARDALRRQAAEQLQRLQTEPPDGRTEVERPTREAIPPVDEAATRGSQAGAGQVSPEAQLAVVGSAYHFRKLQGDPRLVLTVRHQDLFRSLAAAIWAVLCLGLAAAAIQSLRRPNAGQRVRRAWPWLAVLLGTAWLFLLPAGLLGLALAFTGLCAAITRARARTGR
jgi:hypothetical protein